MAKKYVDKEGNYLVIDQCNSGYQIFWYIAEWEDLGGIVGEFASTTLDKNKEEDKATAVAEKAASDYFKKHEDTISLDSGGYTFERLREAKECLAMINHALLNQDVEWPTWAIEAQIAGWKPPKGWKP